MQPSLPGPWDVVVDLLRLLRLPLILLAPLFVAAWVLAWLHAAQTWLKGWRKIRLAGGRSALYVMRQPVVRQVILYLSTASIPASTYGFSRLVIGLDRSGMNNLNPSDANAIISNLSHYSSPGSTTLPMELFWIAVGYVVTVLIDVLVFDGTRIGAILKIPLAIVGLLSAALAALALLGAVFSVGLQQTHAPGGTSVEVVVNVSTLLFCGVFALSTYSFLRILW
jgi:hypothetical protein